MMQYPQFTMATIRKLIAIGADAARAGKSETELVYNLDDCTPAEFDFIQLGYNFPDFVPEDVKTYYRIGEPVRNPEGTYKPSWNFAKDKPENGVSVVTTEWLHSLKSVFFNTTDENIKKRGVYKIRGFELPYKGGDGEKVICPMGYAEKTRIRTRAGLEKAVKSC